jgi:hypothetical protein
MAYQIQKNCENVEHVIYEKNAEIGGTWLENRYPGNSKDFSTEEYLAANIVKVAPVTFHLTPTLSILPSTLIGLASSRMHPTSRNTCSKLSKYSISAST